MFHPKICIIVLNWDNKKDTFECLDSVLKINYPNFKVVLVDNGSEEKIKNDVEARYPSDIVHLIENGENLGFAGGNNSGIEYAINEGADYILLLNNDTVVDKDLITELVSVAVSDNKIGIVGPKIYYFDEPERLWFAGNKTSYFYGRPIKIGHRGYGQIDRGQYDAIEKIGFASGCAMFVRQEVFEKIGFLDEDYFCSAEDADFCIRAAKAGFDIFYAPKAKLWHKEASTFGGLDSPEYVYYQIRNRLLFMKKNFPLWGWLIFIPAFAIIVARRSIRLLLAKNFSGLFAIWQGITDFLKARCGKKRE